MTKKAYKKPYSMKLHLERYLLMTMYMSYCFKMPLDLMVTLYEAFGKYSLFVYKALSCKGYIRISDTAFSDDVAFFTEVEKQLKNGKLILEEVKGKKKEFLEYLIANTANIYSYTVDFFFDLDEWYNGGKNR